MPKKLTDNRDDNSSFADNSIHRQRTSKKIKGQPEIRNLSLRVPLTCIDRYTSSPASMILPRNGMIVYVSVAFSLRHGVRLLRLILVQLGSTGSDRAFIS